MNFDEDYLEIDEDNNKLDFKPPFCIGRGMTLSFIPAGECFTDFLPDMFDWEDFSSLFNFDDALNTPVLLAKISTGIGLKINPFTNSLTIDLIAGLNT